MLTVLTIAGSDACAAAGLQADLRTFQALGLHGLSVVSAVTAQGRASGSRQAARWQTVSDEIFAAQLSAVVAGFEIAAVKTGMLASAGQVEILAAKLPRDIPLVIDPVLSSSSGHRLIDDSTLTALRRLLFPRAWLITPNLPELTQLSGGPDQDIHQRTEVLLRHGCQAVLVKGGHADGPQLTDYLYQPSQQDGYQTHSYSHPRQPGQYRGTGCVLSAAMTAYLASQSPQPGGSLQRICQLGIDYLQTCIVNTPAGDEAVILRHPLISGS